MSIDVRRPSAERTPQEYEVLTGGGAEAAEIGRRGLDRRRLLRRAVGLTLLGISGSATYAALTMLYPNLAGKFGAAITLKSRATYIPAQQKDFVLGQKGMFYEPNAKSYIMHLLPGGSTDFLLSGSNLTDEMGAQNWYPDKDGSYWIALYQVCVHLGCKVPFRDECNSFKCPCHGSHYNIDGEYLDGPAPRSLDRFQMSFDSSDNLVVNTGKLNQTVQRPDPSTRILAVPTVVCPA
jgi:cytochrome b6-f complex iron-sulfur subunit